MKIHLVTSKVDSIKEQVNSKVPSSGPKVVLDEGFKRSYQKLCEILNFVNRMIAISKTTKRKKKDIIDYHWYFKRKQLVLEKLIEMEKLDLLNKLNNALKLLDKALPEVTNEKLKKEIEEFKVKSTSNAPKVGH